MKIYICNRGTMATNPLPKTSYAVIFFNRGLFIVGLEWVVLRLDNLSRKSRLFPGVSSVGGDTIRSLSHHEQCIIDVDAFNCFPFIEALQHVSHRGVTVVNLKFLKVLDTVIGGLQFACAFGR